MSTTAKTCPHCGAKVSRGIGCFGLVVLGLTASTAVCVGTCINDTNQPRTTGGAPAPTQATAPAPQPVVTAASQSVRAPAGDVTLTASLEVGPRPAVVGKTNLPDGTPLLVGLRSKQTRFFGQAKAVVSDGSFRAGPFGGPDVPLAPGPYSVSISSPLPDLQPAEVRAVIGRHGENLRGKLVKRNFGANTVEYKTNVTLRDGAPADFRGIRWGAAPSAALEPVAPPTDGLQVWRNKRPPPDFFGIPVAEESYSFVRRRLFAGAVYLDGEPSFARARQQVAAMYGRPASSNAVSETWSWDRMKVTVSYQPKFQRTTVEFQNDRVR